MITQDIKNKFRRIACALSPENLTCDGELSREAVKKKHTNLMKEWKALEAELGRKVSEDEVYSD